MLDTSRCTNICIMEVPEVERGDKEQLKKKLRYNVQWLHKFDEKHLVNTSMKLIQVI